MTGAHVLGAAVKLQVCSTAYGLGLGAAWHIADERLLTCEINTAVSAVVHGPGLSFSLQVAAVQVTTRRRRGSADGSWGWVAGLLSVAPWSRGPGVRSRVPQCDPVSSTRRLLLYTTIDLRCGRCRKL